MAASVNKGVVVARFRKELYPEEALDAAIYEVGKNIEVEKKSRGNYFDVSMVPRDAEEAGTLVFEFSNYVLSLIKKPPC